MNPPVPPPAASTVAPPWPVLQAPPHWQNLDFISDLHLQASEPATFSAWQNFMQTTSADAVFILGDLFDVWVGDDVMEVGTADAMPKGPAIDPGQASNFEARCAEVLAAASRRLKIFLMHGNRDFLLGPAFARAAGLTMLDDPTVLDLAGQRWLLSHGDALCLLDTDYLEFRAKVRSAQWQQDFLHQPLTQRREVARALRQQSEARKHSALIYTDLDPQASCDWLRTAQASTLIHGHTHKPAEHELPDGLHRIVLSDWDLGAVPPRAEVLRLHVPQPHLGRSATVRRMAAALAAQV